MNPLQIQMFLNDINGNDDEEMVEDYIEQFMIQVNDGKSILEASRRWIESSPKVSSLSWKTISNFWQGSFGGKEHHNWIMEGNGIIMMWSKDSDNVFPYIWWYIGFDKNRGLFESSSWMITGDFYDDSTGVVKVETCNWDGFNLSDLTEEVAVKMLEFNSDWDGELPEGLFDEWANCATGLNLWKTSFTLEELMGKTLNWSNANLQILLG